jgi:hypothetical protein
MATNQNNILYKRELIMMFKVLNGMAPNYLTMLFYKCNNTNYHLRTNNLKMSLPKTGFLKKSFVYRFSGTSYPLDMIRAVVKCHSHPGVGCEQLREFCLRGVFAVCAWPWIAVRFILVVNIYYIIFLCDTQPFENHIVKCYRV